MPKKKHDAITRLSEKYRNSSKQSIIVYLIIRGIIIGVMIRQITLGDWHNVFLCGLSLVLLFIPFFLRSTFKINLPSVLEIAVFLFVFAAEILGEIANFYGHIPIWDTMLHTVTGFLAAAVGFGTIDLLNRHSKRLKMTPLFVALVSFCFSMTVGVVWEFGEYAVDRLLKFDTQKDRIITEISSVKLHPDGENEEVKINGISYTIIFDADGNELARIDGGYLDIGLRDTMKDMLVNMIGAVVFSAAGFLYIHRRDKYKFAESFIITPLEDKKSEITE
ncbi:MAG: hypothetical protein IJD85_01130 [Oscillospiraceae bacterium]|nr:hypothetical protein [Oscillospiraceae bacterium]